MVTIYVLRSQTASRNYVGITQHLDRRLHEHNSGQVASTKAFIPWELIYSETAHDHASARFREKYLKSSAGRN